jgi:hypothetical protein
MKAFYFMALTPLLFIAPLVHAAPDPLRLKPSSLWNVRHEMEFCRLGRAFGEGDQSVQLTFERFGPGDEFRLLISGKAMRERATTSVSIRFGAEQSPEMFGYTLGYFDKIPVWIVEAGRLVPRPDEMLRPKSKKIAFDAPAPPPVLPGVEAAVRYIELGRPFSQPIILETGSLGKPFTAFRECTDELLLKWGVDAERHRTAINLPVPIGSPGDWVTSSDYPIAMEIRGQPALVNFRLMVDEAGQVESCHIQQSTHPDGFSRVCEYLKRRATFAPARDKDSKPMRSYYRNIIRFQI